MFGSKCDNSALRAIAIVDVEVVEVAPGRSHDDYSWQALFSIVSDLSADAELAGLVGQEHHRHEGRGEHPPVPGD
jgi:hypothetical protein